MRAGYPYRLYIGLFWRLMRLSAQGRLANLNVLVTLGSLLLVSGIILIFLQRNTLSSSILLVPGVALCLVGAGHH
jgi:hypothetical protein